MGSAVRAMGGVGAGGATWAWFPPAAGRLSHQPTGRQAHPPRNVYGKSGGHPLKPPAEGDSPSPPAADRSALSLLGLGGVRGKTAGDEREEPTC